MSNIRPPATCMTSGMRVPLPSVEEILASVDYCPITGAFTRKSTARTITRTTSAGYIQFRIGRKLFVGHRIAWKIMTGLDPVADIDHADGDRKNNKFSNLREATPSENAKNRRVRNGLEFKGIYQSRGLWIAHTRVSGKPVRLGSSKSKDVAAKIYDRFAAGQYGPFARLNSEGTA